MSHQRYTPEFKDEAVPRHQDIGRDGLPCLQAARPQSTTESYGAASGTHAPLRETGPLPPRPGGHQVPDSEEETRRLGTPIRPRGASGSDSGRNSPAGSWGARRCREKCRWEAGQYVSIVASSLDLSGLFRIESLTMSFEPGSMIRQYEMTCERVPRNPLKKFLEG